MSHKRKSTNPSPLDKLDNKDVLRALVEGTVAETGAEFFRALVKNLHYAIGVHGAWVAEYEPGSDTIRALAFWLGDKYVDDYVYRIEGTPCADVVENLDVIHIPERLLELYPKDPDIREAGAVSYMGAPLFDVDGTLLGHLAVMDTSPMPPSPIFSRISYLLIVDPTMCGWNIPNNQHRRKQPVCSRF